MKNIEEYIIEQEFDDHFLIEEGFFSWIVKLGKKFWAWLTSKDYTGKDVDWNVGEKKKLQWVNTKSSVFKKITNNKGLAKNFPATMRIIDKVPSLVMMQAINSSKTPVIMMLLTSDKETITKILKNTAKNYYKYVNRVANVENPIMILSIEIARGNSDDDDDLFDDFIRNEIDKNIVNSYDVVYIDQRRLHNSFQTLLQYEYDFEKDFPVFSAEMDWDDIDNKNIIKNHDNHDEETSQEEIPKAHDGDIEIEKKTPKPKDKNIPDNIIEFTDTSNDEVIATAEYTNDPKRKACLKMF